MALLRKGWDGVPVSEAVLLGVSEEGYSLWRERNDSSERLYLYGPGGEQARQGTVTFDNERSGSGFWTAIGPELSVWKAYYETDSMRIVGYSW